MRATFLIVCLLPSFVCPAQWNRLESPTKADLLSVSSSGHAVWASGANGTIVRSSDDGGTWSVCATPKGTASQTFSSIQAIEDISALVMTSGRAEKSRLFRTVDACRTWTEVFKNPEPNSSFDSLRRVTSKQVYLLGEPVNGKFQMYVSQDAGATWFIADDPGLDAAKGETAEGSNLTSQGPFLYFGSSSTTGAYVHFTASKCTSPTDCVAVWQQSNVLPEKPAPVMRGVAVQMQMDVRGNSSLTLVAVGKSRAASEGTPAFAAFLSGNNSWILSNPAPDGPLAAVAYDGGTVSWISVGASGTYISHDHAKTWKTSSVPDATKWTALSLPYAVGSEGRIGKLAPNALQR